MTFWAIIILAATVALALSLHVFFRHRDNERLRGMRAVADAKR